MQVKTEEVLRVLYFKLSWYCSGQNKVVYGTNPWVNIILSDLDVAFITPCSAPAVFQDVIRNSRTVGTISNR